MFPFCSRNANEVTIVFRLTEDQRPAKRLQINEDGAAPILVDGLAAIVAKALEKSIFRTSTSYRAGTQPPTTASGYLTANAMLADVQKVQR